MRNFLSRIHGDGVCTLEGAAEGHKGELLGGRGGRGVEELLVGGGEQEGPQEPVGVGGGGGKTGLLRCWVGCTIRLMKGIAEQRAAG